MIAIPVGSVPQSQQQALSHTERRTLPVIVSIDSEIIIRVDLPVVDTMPKCSVSIVIGIGGLVGGLAGMTTARFVGYILEFTGSYYTLFAAASCLYVIAMLVLVTLSPESRFRRDDRNRRKPA